MGDGRNFVFQTDRTFDSRGSMLNPKKHPLEIFRERRRQGPLLSRDAANATSGPARGVGSHDAEKSDVVAAERAPHPRWEPTEFELRLSLGSTVLVAMTWIVLLAAAYVLGVSNGREQQLLASDQGARARGAVIENSTDSGTSSDGQAGARPTADAWYGVRLASYPASIDKYRPLIEELKDSLAKTYGESLGLRREEIQHWEFSKKDSAVYAGCFATEDDPKLIELAANLRKINDWPRGNDQSPFKSAEIRRLPDGQLAKKLGLTRSPASK